MRRLSGRVALALGCVALALAGGSCKRREIIQTEKTEETPTELASVVQMADPTSSLQLLRGFHSIEGNAWRWTARTFALTLRPPVGGATNGGTLVAKFSIPDTVISRVHRMTLSAKVNGTELPSETYTKAGEYGYSRDVPATALRGEAVTCEFSLDKALPPTGADDRELGLVMQSIGLEGR